MYRDNDRCLAKVDADEPIFVLRAQDLSAPLTISYWLLQNNGTLTDAHFDEARQVMNAMYMWQREHADRAKRPD